jgi:SAM-dependent methyltransferase
MKEISCPVCGFQFQPLYRVERFTPALEILRCPNCGLQRLAEFPPDLKSLYGEGYYTGAAGYSYEDERDKEPYYDHVWRARLRTIHRHIPPPASLLDVGCSFGGFVEAASRAGYSAAGVDLSEYAVKQGRLRGRNLIHGDLSDVSGRFDVITAIEVLEHLPDPQGTFARFFELLHPGGLVVIQTANFLGRQAQKAGAAYHYYLPGHLYYYSTNNLRMLLQRHGFHRIKFYRGVDFGLMPKLRKMRGSFKSIRDYRRMIPVALYHLKSRIAFGDFALTSSMVCYARKPG